MATFNKLAPQMPQQPNIRPPMQVGDLAMHGEPDADDLPSAADSPPSARDAKQSIVHHVSSVEYNAKHASAHQQETAKHAGALLQLLKKQPGFAEHAKKM